MQTLIALRNGVVHAAEDAEVEERILTAFVQQADTLLTDFGRGREDFWDGQLAVANALLTDASDKLAASRRGETRCRSSDDRTPLRLGG